MNRILRIVLLYLLAMALPLQGWAAVTQTVCPPAMHQMSGQNMDVGMQHDDTHKHAMHAEHQQDAHAAANASSDVHQGQGKDHRSMKHDNHAGATTCSICAVCHVGAALLPTMPEFAAPACDTALVATVDSSLLPNHIPDGIKRPPRHFSV
ncbi:hypothetical protein [uncultured Oxalicibacterium sp.]|uniref:hypothetical protein n=1 Tax=uncultured Oxalicibacterium sp. TaxID=1168540 RepID=UPI0025EEE785|nr:hypothetical protein [uncultured Oxalicibacterium sp.]